MCQERLISVGKEACGFSCSAQRTKQVSSLRSRMPESRSDAVSSTAPHGPLQYLVHPYNETWRYERCIEVPLARAFIAAHPGRGIEVGNVLSHYGAVTHEVFDKYERARRVRNLDVLDIVDGDLAYVVCISTLEHVGWDEPERDEAKAVRALAHLRSFLSPRGRVFVSFRLGHHPALTGRIRLSVELEPSTLAKARHGNSSQGGGSPEFDPDHHDVLWVGVVPPSRSVRDGAG